ncbi:transcription factor SPT20, partial [Tremellales sp. Uapishka_1]
MASASGYNHQRFARAVLKKSRKWEPSLTVQLYPNYWRFEGSQITFQYDGPMKPFLLSVRAQVIPSSLIPFLYDIQPPISFVDGCLVVEIQDFRKNPEVRSRVVMRPSAETLAETIEVMLERRGESWDENTVLELESRIIAATSPPLYLGTSILATRNAVLSLALTAPAGPNLSSSGAMRSPSSLETDSQSEVETMRKLLRAGERPTSFQPNWSILRLKERMERMDNMSRMREKDAMMRARGGSMGDAMGMHNGMGSVNGSTSASANGQVEEKKKSKKKRPIEVDDDKKSKKKKIEDDGKKKKKDGEGKKKSKKKKDEDDD